MKNKIEVSCSEEIINETVCALNEEQRKKIERENKKEKTKGIAECDTNKYLKEEVKMN